MINNNDDVNKSINAVKELVKDALGVDQVIIGATKLEVLPLLKSDSPFDNLRAMEFIVFHDKNYTFAGDSMDIDKRLTAITDELADILTMRELTDKLERAIAERMLEKQDDYYQEVKAQILRDNDGVENAATLKKYADLELMDQHKLSKSAMEQLRPGIIDEIIGQDEGVRSLLGKISSPYPQHILLYGPPGVGKTTAARLVLDRAKLLATSSFSADAPFVEVDGTTLRFDPRDATNPLIGSVHDPIYQGARRDLADIGVPEPKLGLVSEANGGILFIDEIGEMDPLLLNKLLKVMEDKRVYFESSYYNAEDPEVPKYIKKMFDQGVPADFILIGATTRSPEDISSAIRSRCGEVYFSPLNPSDIREIVRNAAKKLKITIKADAIELIADYTIDGRKAVNILSDAYGIYLYNKRDDIPKRVVLTAKNIQDVLNNSRLSPFVRDKASDDEVIGKTYGLGVYGFLGSVLEIEAVLFKSSEKGKGSVRFNEQAGSMATDSVFNVMSVFRYLEISDFNDYDIHVNIIGGGNIDGPSAGCAIFVALYSALRNKPIKQNIAITGEMSIRGVIRPVGGIREKIYGAKQSGMSKIVIPADNMDDVPSDLKGIKVIPCALAKDLIKIVFE